MLLAAVVHLEAQKTGLLHEATGHAVHGFWFRHWETVNPAVADHLHGAHRFLPFTVSPLMGLPHPRRRQVTVNAGDPAWFRVTALESDLAARLEEEWLPRLPEEVVLAGLGWRVTGWNTNTTEHPWASRTDPQALAESRLLAPSPPERWRLAFATPTAFHGAGGHLPFPLPNVLVGSWLRRWQAFGPVHLPEDLDKRVRQGLVVSTFALKTVPVREPRRIVIGCVGQMTMRALTLRPGERAAVDLLAAYAFWTGSGHHTTQGMGMTRVVPETGPLQQWRG